MANHNRRLFLMMNVIGFIFSIVMNFLAIALPLNGNDTRTLSEKYTNLFVPAPFAFSIWSVIYLSLLIFVIISLIAYAKDDQATLAKTDAIGPWFFWSAMCNGLWIVAWHYEQLFLSICIMLALLYSLIKIYTSLHALRPLPWKTSLWLLIPFSIYLGWISVATIANFAAFFVSISWEGFGLEPSLWAKIMMTIAALLALIVVLKKQDIAFVFVVMWALFAIYSRHYNASLVPEQEIGKFALTLLIFLSIYSFLMVMGRKFYLFEKK